MGSICNHLLSWITVLVVVGAILMSGCVQSPKTKQLDIDLAEFDKDLNTALENIHNISSDYSLRSKQIFFGQTFTTQYSIDWMQQQEQRLKEWQSKAEQVIFRYESLKKEVDIGQLDKNQKNIVDNIEKEISIFQSNKNKLNLCLSKMENFRQLASISRLNLFLMEELSKKRGLIEDQIELEEYAAAFQNIKIVKNISIELQLNREKLGEMGILKLGETSLDYWKLYASSLDELEKYVNMLESEDYDSAEQQYEIFSKSETKFQNAAKKAGQELSLLKFIEELDRWHGENIGTCSSLFEN